jgi:hypothetical protein
MPLEAIRSAVAGELWPLAANLAGSHALTLIMAGRGRALERTLARIDRTVLGGQPELAGALALARVARGSDAKAAALISLGRAAPTNEIPDHGPAASRTPHRWHESGRMPGSRRLGLQCGAM